MGSFSITQRLQLAGVPEYGTPCRLATLERLSEVYASERLLQERAAPALHHRCSDAPDCWAKFPQDAKPANAEQYGFDCDDPGSVIWPWVGEEYRPGGVALLTLNFRSGDGEATVALEYLAAWHAKKQLREGRRRDTNFNSAFAYNSLASAAVVLASSDDLPMAVSPEPESLIATMESVARLQLVKCTPVDSVVERGSPSKTMCQRCPPRFLRRELAILNPGVLIVFGVAAYEQLALWPQVRWGAGTYVCRGTMRTCTSEIALIWLFHPSSTDWTQSQHALVRSLRSRPITALGRDSWSSSWTSMGEVRS
jgi:hypothetical protein